MDGEPALGLDVKSMTDAIFTAGLIAMGFFQMVAFARRLSITDLTINQSADERSNWTLCLEL